MKIKSNYFYGNKVSDYGIENGYVDYATLSKAFNHVSNNDIMNNTYDIGYWEQVSGIVDNEEEIQELQEQIEELEDKLEDIQEDEKVNEEMENSLIEEIQELQEQIEELEDEQNNSYDEIFQYYIVDEFGAELLKEINEIVFYNYELDMHVWGVTHYGTSWDYVLTNIEIEKE